MKISNAQRLTFALLMLIALFELGVTGKFGQLWVLAFSSSLVGDEAVAGQQQAPPAPQPVLQRAPVQPPLPIASIPAATQGEAIAQ